MKVDEHKLVALISVLTKATSEGSLVWELGNPPSSLVDGTDDIFPLYFEATYKNQRIALYEKRFQVFNVDEDRLFWTERKVLALLDRTHRSLWEYAEQSTALLNLFTIVRRSTAQIDKIIDQLLS
jgi:hypothetical protein